MSNAFSFAILAMLVVEAAQADEPCHAVAASAVTVAPFAIPVAVPVAVVQQPTLFYGYGRYAPAATPAPPITPAAMTPVAEEPTVSIAALLTKHCAECHQGPTARGGLQLFAADGVPLALCCRASRWPKRAPRPTARHPRCRRRAARRSRRKSKRKFADGPCRRRRCGTERSVSGTSFSVPCFVPPCKEFCHASILLSVA